jgi:hypothetical protein
MVMWGGEFDELSDSTAQVRDILEVVRDRLRALRRAGVATLKAETLLDEADKELRQAKFNYGHSRMEP